MSKTCNARPTLQFRAPQSELDSYKRAADAAGLTVSEWARTVLRREAGLWTGQREERTTMKTTTDTITTKQIRALMAEAGEAGDLAMVAICCVALAQGLDDIADVGEQRAALEQMGIIPEHVGARDRARAECARVIAAAEAQRDE